MRPAKGDPDPIAQFQEELRGMTESVGAALRPLLPFVGQAAASMGAYALGLTLVQGAGVALRVSCATPVLGPACGLLGVGLASALAGQAALAAREAVRDATPGWTSARGVARAGAAGEARWAEWPGSNVQTMLMDAALGVVLFKVMGGSFRSIMPSNAARVGAIARESIPSMGGKDYAGHSSKRELLRIFRRDGCHHCGARGGGQVIADHMPPNKLAPPPRFSLMRRLATRSTLVRRAATALGLEGGPPRQRYYPQCLDCCRKQATAVRTGRMALIGHKTLHRGGTSSAWHWAGMVVGLRHYSTATAATTPWWGRGTLRTRGLYFGS